MSRHLENYSENETIATGLNRPKTTALFFDKLWVPPDFIASNDTLSYKPSFRHSPLAIPKELCVTVDSWMGMDDSWRVMEAQQMPVFPHNIPYVVNSAYVHEDDPRERFLFSVNRNKFIMKSSIEFQKFYNIELVPVFLDYTDFEKAIIDRDNELIRSLLDQYPSGTLDHTQLIKNIESLLKTQSSAPKKNAYEVSINYIPEIIEDELTWEQVIEMKKDSKAIKKLRRFRVFLNSDLKGKTEQEVLEILELAIDDYASALKSYGIHTTIGAMAFALSSSATILGALAGTSTAITAAGCIITSGTLSFASAQVKEYLETKKAPIAFIYDTLHRK